MEKEPTVRTINVTNQHRPGPNATYCRHKGSWDWFNKHDLQKWLHWKDQQRLSKTKQITRRGPDKSPQQRQ